MPKINIKKYSRSNLDNPSTESIEQSTGIDSIVKKTKGRPKKVTINESNQDTEPQIIPDYEPNHEIIEPLEIELPNLDIPNLDMNDPFLDELNSNNFREPPTQEEKRETEKAFKECLKQKTKQIKSQEKINSIYESSDLFDDNPSEIIGRDRRVIINKLNQYRNLFPNELSKFKVKKNASIQELQAYLDEMATIVETSSYDNFLTDSILQAIKLAENGSKYTRHDISGCADMLKSNPQFNCLMKQMYVKYNVFHKIPCEFQLLLLVTTTAYICSNKNKNKAQLESYLSQPVS